MCYNNIMKGDKKMKPKARTRVLFNTGTRVHKPKKGRGAYSRKERQEKT
jgi:stalled ribosome alternative rescue factor ArfA